MERLKFALLGAAGYIAPRHMKAIKETGHELVVAFDKNDSVGILDKYFPNAKFSLNQSEFPLYAYDHQLDFVSICTPNYYHYENIIQGLEYGCHVICEKPMVLNPDVIADIKKQMGRMEKNVNVILQLRLHPEIQRLKREMGSSNKRHKINLKYITGRGHWYQSSWKGDENKSGGLIMNIGIHLFDMLIWIFGVPKGFKVMDFHNKIVGILSLENADVEFLLSIDFNDLPKGRPSIRSLEVDGYEIEFTKGFEDLHTLSYKKIIEGKGFSVEDATPAIQLIYDIKKSVEYKYQNNKINHGTQ